MEKTAWRESVQETKHTFTTKEKKNKMKYLKFTAVLVAALALASVAAASPLPSNSPAGIQPMAQAKQLVIYMQMGGTQGDASTLARTNGAKAAAADFGIKLVEQYSGWDPQKMIDQFKQAMAANPDGIEIMGHPGEDAFSALVDQAESQGIIVTSGNNPLPNIEAKYQTKGFGYAGADLHDGGFLTGQAMVAAGLKKGDKALVYDIWHQEGRSKSPQGIYDALTAAGLVVDKLDVSNDVDTDSSLAIPILTAYIAAHPDLKAIGTQHGNITAILPKVLQAAGKKPGDIICGGIDLSPATVDAIKNGWISASFDQVLYLQGYTPVQQIVLTKTLLIPGLHINTGVGTVTPQNVALIAPLIQQGVR
jgi:simple sugar transport system substrate-binding protein